MMVKARLHQKPIKLEKHLEIIVTMKAKLHHKPKHSCPGEKEKLTERQQSHSQGNDDSAKP